LLTIVNSPDILKVQIPEQEDSFMNKLPKIAKTLDVWFKVGYWFTIVVTVLCIPIILIFLLLSRSNPALFQGMAQSLSFGNISFRIAEAYAAGPDAGRTLMLLSLIIGVISFPVYCLMIRSIRKILAPMKDGLPFQETISKSLMHLGWLVIIDGALGLVLDTVSSRIIFSVYDMEALFLSEKITSVSTFYHLNFTFILYALILMGLACIFRYGQELQQLSDETL